MLSKPSKTRTTALSVLDAGRLRELVDAAGLAVSDRRSRDVLIQALADGRRVDLAKLLASHASREELKSMCRATGLPDEGREKATLVERLRAELTNGSPKEGSPELAAEPPPQATRTFVISLLNRDELLQVVDEFRLQIADRRVLQNIRDEIDRSSGTLTAIIDDLTRARLKEICRVLRLDDGGKEKAPIVDRIVRAVAQVEEDLRSEADADDEPEKPGFGPQILAELLGPRLAVREPNGYWPATTTLVLNGNRLDADIYARVIGGTGRNPLERRFQNPASGVAIRPTAGRPCLLLGIWLEQGLQRAVLVAFDAYRRQGKTTRVSHFMPLSLLEEAADTGFVGHKTASGEVIYAFRPDLIARYMDAFLEDGTWGDLDAGPWASVIEQAPPTIRHLAPPRATTDSVEIRPKAGMFAAFARLNYKPWFALAELVDNAVQSYLSNQARLEAAGSSGPLIVDLNIDTDEISVTDRAAGIRLEDFPRAFSPATPPEDASGLSEFGLGMKAAACWFAREWSVRTSALGEPVERTVTFDVPAITAGGLDQLPIQTRDARPTDHYTVITMRNLRVRPRGTTLAKVKEHLASIYRLLIADGTVRVRVTAAGKTEELAYEQPKLLTAPFFKDPEKPAVTWRTEFSITRDDRRVSGWAGILETGKHSRAGFSVFRRRRLIEGSVGEAYRHRRIFGAHNSFKSQRIVGELYVEGFDVTHTKDGIQWGDDEDGLALDIKLLLEDPLPLLEQAEGFRARKRAEDLPSSFGHEAVDGAAAAIEALANVVAIDEPEPGATVDEPPRSQPLSGATTTQERELRIPVGDTTLLVRLELIRDPASEWLDCATVNQGAEEMIQIRINLAHPFSEEHLNDEERALDPVIRLAAAIAIGERQARQQGVRGCGAVRRNANQLLRTGFSSAAVTKEEA